MIKEIGWFQDGAFDNQVVLTQRVGWVQRSGTHQKFEINGILNDGFRYRYTHPT